jgi:hypothetical protein
MTAPAFGLRTTPVNDWYDRPRTVCPTAGQNSAIDHRPSDEIKAIDFPPMTDAIRSMLEPIRWLANSDFQPGSRKKAMNEELAAEDVPVAGLVR